MLKKVISALVLLMGMTAALYLGVYEDAKQAQQTNNSTVSEVEETEKDESVSQEDTTASVETENSLDVGAKEQTAEAEKKQTTDTENVKKENTDTPKTENKDLDTEFVEQADEEELLFEDWELVETYKVSKMLFAQSNVNVRKGPDTIYDIVGTVSTNDQIETIGSYKNGEWIEVNYKDEVAFISGKYLGEDQIDLEALRAEQEAAAMAAIEADLQKQQEAAAAAAQTQTEPAAQPAEQPAQTAPAPAPEPAPAPYIAQPAGVVFVGDSRCVQMQAAVGGGGSTWICEGGKRVSWMEENAVPRLDNIVGKGTKVVICMGVNDPWHYPEYAALTNRKAAEWNARGATVYFVSVNPVWENPYVTQEQVDTFNANIPGMLNGVRWIDTASIVKQGGYKLVDGLHYDTNAYINLFNLICGSL